MTPQARVAGVLAAAAVVLTVGVATTQSARGNAAQQLRRCVDRWNQGGMHWGPSIVFVEASPTCSVTIAYTYTFSPAGGCKPAARYRDHPDFCLDRRFSFICRLNRFEAYECPTHANGLRLPRQNAKLNGHGRITLNHPLTGTHPTRLLPWQRRYTYHDDYIYPWTTAGKLRDGLTLHGNEHGHCESWLGAGYRCSTTEPTAEIRYPCFPQSVTRKLRVVFACATAPGATAYTRLVGSPY